MKRFAQTIHLKPNALEAYTALHAQPWTEILEALAQFHIRNYSIFRFGLTLFAYLEYHGSDWEADQRSLASLPRLAEWAALTADMQQPLEDRAAGDYGGGLSP